MQLRPAWRSQVFRPEDFAGRSKFRRTQGLEKGITMTNNFDYLFTAWMCVWIVFFGYEISIARRLSRVRKELADLKQQLHGR
jgi:CcmD family protein